ncbi:MAG: hypothetical protein VYA51_06165 [Planctomycetota bacterium]|nr:hypothetical protein [Planctomycetota bacterium]
MYRSRDEEFNAFRREHERAKLRAAAAAPAAGADHAALRELERVEAVQLRDQQLAREMQEFFSEATRQAAAIVEKVAFDAESAAAAALQEEVESFFTDAAERMSHVVQDALASARAAGGVEHELKPDVKLLVGVELDGFRYAGAPKLRDTHIGKDPFVTKVEDAQAQLRGQAVQPSRGDAPNPRPPEHAASCARSQLRGALDTLLAQGAMDQVEAEAIWRSMARSSGERDRLSDPARDRDG